MNDLFDDQPGYSRARVINLARERPPGGATIAVNETPDYVYVGRPGIWGNPFRIGFDGTREEVVEKYKVWIAAPERAALRARARVELRGKVLGCWCKPEACHADVLMRIANER